MTLMKSISGIRGTIGGCPGKSLSPLDVVKYTSAYAEFIKRKNNSSITIVIGRDGRISGKMISDLVTSTLISCGCNVIDIGLSTTPTVELAVKFENASGGIIITASHNPKNWNALKLLNENGEFISFKDGNLLLSIAEKNIFNYNEVSSLGEYKYDDSLNQRHINHILNLDLVDVSKVQDSKFKVVVDCVNSTGSIMVPQLLKKMGVEYTLLNSEVSGHFAHNPEPLPENLNELANTVVSSNSDLGIAIDPDVDRLALVCEDGSFFGEEYTLVSVADYVLSKKAGNTVSNLSSTRALKDLTDKYEKKYYASAVGEVNVVEKMKECNAVIGGEGNGGIIYPDSHYGRDALLGIALFLTHLAEKKISMKQLRDTYPSYVISKNKIEIPKDLDFNFILSKLSSRYINENISEIDGLKIDFKNGWVHVRKSNTEPIIRIYAESYTKEDAQNLADSIIDKIMELI